MATESAATPLHAGDCPGSLASASARAIGGAPRERGCVNVMCWCCMVRLERYNGGAAALGCGRPVCLAAARQHDAVAGCMVTVPCRMVPVWAARRMVARGELCSGRALLGASTARGDASPRTPGASGRPPTNGLRKRLVCGHAVCDALVIAPSSQHNAAGRLRACRSPPTTAHPPPICPSLRLVPPSTTPQRACTSPEPSVAGTAAPAYRPPPPSPPAASRSEF